MAFKVFLDANILLDFTLKRDGYHNSKRVIEKVVGGHISAFISPSIVHIVGYWLTKAYGGAKAKELLLALLANIKVLEINHEITVLALHSKINDIEDALQYYTAIHHKVDVFISEDKQLKKEATALLAVSTPLEFLKTIEEDDH